MNKLINKLPKEVIDIIIIYTYKPQSIELINDIVSFVFSKNIIINIFKKRYFDFTFDQIEKHLSFHIYSFIIGLKNIYCDCINKLSKIRKRSYMLNNKKYNIENYFSKNNFQKIIFNIYWGLLTVEERNQFINIQIKMDTQRAP